MTGERSVPLAHCAECGFDPSSVPAEVAATEIRRTADRYASLPGRVPVGADGSEWARSTPGVWSPVECLAHVRDVLELFDHQVRQILTEPGGQLEVVDHEATIRESRPGLGDVQRLLEDIASAADALASTLDSVGRDQWHWQGFRLSESRTTGEIALRAVHELTHHFLDVERGLGSDAVSEVRVLPANSRTHESGDHTSASGKT